MHPRERLKKLDKLGKTDEYKFINKFLSIQVKG